MDLKKFKDLKNDILAGITTSLAMVPESVAFAFVAGLSPIVGLHTSFIIGVVAALFGGRPGMISGAAGSIAVVFAELILKHGVEYLFATVVLMGIIQILIGIFKWGKFSRMIPHSVMLGFVNGLAIVIFTAQLGQFKVKDALGNSNWMQGSQLFVMIGLVLITMLVTHYLPKLTAAIPSSLAAIIITTILSYLAMRFGIDIPNVRDFAGEPLAAGLPKFHVPNLPLNFETLKITFPYAVIGTLVGLIESLLTLSLVDDLTDTRGSSNKECVGQGIGNLLNGFLGGTGGCAMIGQSIVNITSGGRGRASGVAMGVSLLIFVLFGSKVIEIIPLAALVGVMFIVVIETFAWSSIKIIKRIPKKDAVVIIIVTLVTVFEDLAVAVILGIIISSLTFAWEKGKKISATVKLIDGVKHYKLDGPLFFGSATYFKEIFDIKNDSEKVVIDFKNSSIKDHSAIEALNSLTEKYEQNGKKLYLINLNLDSKLLLKNAKSFVKINIESK
ncbi:SulP family inorganic anion transporter [Cetobacterium sp.]|uniref:SulP family inorganic anion transporter n=1 Tax=Cetobacterium sp. TaxID=2071632 RepID=UPI003F3CFC18